LIALVAGSQEAASAAVYYTLCYTVMNVGAFMVLLVVESKEGGDTDFTSFTGLGRRHPYLGAIMTWFMISLAGIPPTAGFAAKFLLFKAALGQFEVTLVVLAVVNSLISVYYYLRIVVVMFMIDTESEFKPVNYPAFLFVGLVITAVGVLVLGVMPTYVFPLDQPLLLP